MVTQSDIVVGVALAVALVAIALMIGLARRGGPRERPARTDAEAPPPPQVDEDLLLKFVEDSDGNRRGETVAYEGDRVVLKGADAFFLVAADHLELRGDTVRVVGTVDWDEAKRQGEAWRERHHKVIDYDESELPKDAS